MDDKQQRVGRGKEQLDHEAEDEREQSQQAEADVRRRVMWRKAKGRAGAAAVPSTSGDALPDHVRTRMEPLLGGNLSGVRVHTGGESAEAATGLGARAFTVGSDVHFGAGEFAPGSKEGDRLLAHELTHVVQGERSGVRRKAQSDETEGHDSDVSHPHEPAEVEADAAADHVTDHLHGAGDGANAHGADAGAHGAEAGGGGHAKGAAPAAATAPAAKAAPAPISAKYIAGPRVYRKAPAASAPAKPSSASGGATPGAPVDPLTPLRDALTANNRGQVAQAWSKLSPADHKKVTQADVLASFDSAPSVALQMMKAIGADFSTAAYATKLLSIPKPEAWMGDMATYGLWDSFIKSSPKHQELTKPQRDALGGFVQPGHARPVFEKAYPKLQDATYNAAILKSTKWNDDDIKRLYNAFDGVPVAHVQASAGGFFLGTDHNLSGKKWEPLHFAWQQGDKMVLPKSSSSATGGGTSHDMTGGTKSGATMDIAGTPGGGKTQSHFVGSASHEVGHAVSNAVGGDAWSTTRNGFTPVAMDTWSKALFDDAAVDKAVATDIAGGKLKKTDTLTGAQMRAYLTNAIQGKVVLPAGWTEPKAITFITKYGSSQALYHYYNTAKKTGDDYQLPATNLVGGQAYAYLKRYNGGQTCTYKADTYNNRVSWYSISSPAEWFAENYSHYYRMEGKHPEKDVKTYFDGLDKYKWTPSGASGSLAPGGEAGGEAAAAGGGAEGKKDAAGGAAPQDGKQADQQKDDETNAKATADIHRMPFAW